MGTVRSSHINPAVFDSPIDRVDISKSRRKDAKALLETELSNWEDLKRTGLYAIVERLAGPKIAHYRNEVSKSIMDFPGWPVEVVERYQAECRGAMREWLMIRDKPGALKQQLEDIDREESKREKQEAGKEPEGQSRELLKIFT